jgi:murein DD-endopeptidase MepM/ murein hydrolase activator NlpD
VTGRRGSLPRRTGVVSLPLHFDRRLASPRSRTKGRPLPRPALRSRASFRLPALLSLVLGALLVLVVTAPDRVPSDAEHGLAMVGDRLAMGLPGDPSSPVGARSAGATGVAPSGTAAAASWGSSASAASDQPGGGGSALGDGPGSTTATDDDAPVDERPVDAEPVDVRPEVFAQVEGLELRLPSPDVITHGFHQALSRASLAMEAVGDEQHLLPSRGRGTPATSAVDIVLVDDDPVRSPVTGTVERTERFHVYGEHPDRRIVIAPDDAPELRVVVLHVTGVEVAPGDRVEAGDTVLAAGARRFPFRSQVDDVTAPDAWPHVHLEVRRGERA